VELWDKLVAAPWTAEEHPDIARWAERRSPVLDLFGVAVRKPNFVNWRPRPEFGSAFMVLLPDVQANRDFARDLRVRVTERLGKGDVDGAWYDVMSMFYLSRKHYLHDPIYVTNLVGIAVEGQGWEAAKIIMQNGKPTPEQLERFAKDLESLQGKPSVFSEYEHRSGYTAMQLIQNDRNAFHEVFDYGQKKKSITNLETFFLYLFGGLNFHRYVIPRYITSLPIDRNIAGKRITKLLQTEQHKSGSLAWNVSSIGTKKHLKDFDRHFWEKSQQLNSCWSFWRVPLIRTRSELIADYIVCLLYPAVLSAQNSLDRANAQLTLLRIAVALERYKAAHEKYPAVLDDLVPKYLEEIPLDPFTGRLTLVYKPEAKDGKPFVLYSLGANGIDDGGDTSKDDRKNDVVW